MGLTSQTVKDAVKNEISIVQNSGEKTIALAGNPNVGKSTVFNALTGMNQHTGNWPGKTVSNAVGSFTYKNEKYSLVDLPGTYSVFASSAEEEIARDFICFGGADAVAVVADATCLERNLNLIIQILEITNRAVVCVNLVDEAEKKNIAIDIDELSLQLGVPVAATSARSKNGLDLLVGEIAGMANGETKTYATRVTYSSQLENALSILTPLAEKLLGASLNPRWACMRLLDGDDGIKTKIEQYFDKSSKNYAEFAAALLEIKESLEHCGITEERLRDSVVSAIVKKSEHIYRKCVKIDDEKTYNACDRRLDKILTSKLTGIPIMIALLCLIFWITITGANYPSAVLSELMFWIEEKLNLVFISLCAPEWVRGLFVEGMFRTLGWVVAVMLPPMAIFFPLFTLLEDSGYLPRIAFNLDKFFKRANCHGKQSLTTCMGFGCNACGVIGCRIIDSPRERLIAILTNNFTPCNGRFPTLITIITIFFVGSVISPLKSVASTAILTAVIVLSVAVTLLISKLLSATILKGMPSSFVLELPPYRAPQVGKVIVRSIFDRTLFVLGRAAAVAAPAGMVIWLMSNITVGDASLLRHCADFLDPFARLMGLDGVILFAFILGFPANEIVFPIIIMSYLNTGAIMQLGGLNELKALLVNNGWTWVTALCTMLFSLMHFPCATTCLTIKKETGSFKWTALAWAIPTLTGVIACMIVSAVSRIFI